MARVRPTSRARKNRAAALSCTARHPLAVRSRCPANRHPPPPLVIRDHAVDYFFFIFLRKVYLAKWYAERRRDPHCIEPVLAPRALDKLRLPYLDERPHHVNPALFQERGGNSRISAP